MKLSTLDLEFEVGPFGPGSLVPISHDPPTSPAWPFRLLRDKLSAIQQHQCFSIWPIFRESSSLFYSFSPPPSSSLLSLERLLRVPRLPTRYDPQCRDQIVRLTQGNRSTSISNTVANRSEELSWGCMERPCPRLPKTSVHWLLERRTSVLRVRPSIELSRTS